MYDNTVTEEILNQGNTSYVPMKSTEPPNVTERFENFVISTDRVYDMIGKRRAGEVSFEQSEQGDARRQLLHVEKVAIENKRLQKTSETSYIESVSYQLHDIIVEEMSEYLKDVPDVMANVLNLPSNTGELLDALIVRACSVSKLEPIVATIPWMYDELISVVNTARFRRKDSRGRVIVVETLRTALSFLGIENLRLLIPFLIVKRATPQITDPYPLIKQKLASYSTGVAISAQCISEAAGTHKGHGYMLGMLSNLGRCAVTRLYFRLFDKVQMHLLQECQKDREHKRHDALTKIIPSANHLIALQHAFADTFNADLLDELSLKRLFIAPAMRAVANQRSETTSALSDTATLSETQTPTDMLKSALSQARIYARIRLLHQNKLIEATAANRELLAQRFPAGALATLKNTDIFALPLVKSDIED